MLLMNLCSGQYKALKFCAMNSTEQALQFLFILLIILQLQHNRLQYPPRKLQISFLSALFKHFIYWLMYMQVNAYSLCFIHSIPLFSIRVPHLRINIKKYFTSIYPTERLGWYILTTLGDSYVKNTAIE
jgi:hypothetical protein